MAAALKIKDLTPQEAHEAFAALRSEIGAKCYISAGLVLGRCLHSTAKFQAQMWPKDLVGGGPQLSAEGASWRELVEGCRAVWAAHIDLHAANTIREMALKIIEITADRGECTDAALRAEFDATDVVRFADRAVEAANEMANNGPFSIVTLSGANDQYEAA